MVIAVKWNRSSKIKPKVHYNHYENACLFKAIFASYIPVSPDGRETVVCNLQGQHRHAAIKRLRWKTDFKSPMQIQVEDPLSHLPLPVWIKTRTFFWFLAQLLFNFQINSSTEGSLLKCLFETGHAYSASNSKNVDVLKFRLVQYDALYNGQFQQNSS